MTTSTGWFYWAALSACFAALTAIFAKIGIRGVDSDFATLLRTVMIVLVLAPFVWFAGKWSNPLDLPPKSLLFLVLSACATGASWVCYFRALQMGDAAKVAPSTNSVWSSWPSSPMRFWENARPNGIGSASRWWRWACWCLPSSARGPTEPPPKMM